MSSPTACDLTRKKCVPCEGGAQPLAAPEVQQLLTAVPDWKLVSNGKAIQRSWKCRDFVSALKFVNSVGEIAEKEDHHPDIHITGYRNLTIEMSTHAINGLSENDFILAAKIDEVPMELKR